MSRALRLSGGTHSACCVCLWPFENNHEGVSLPGAPHTHLGGGQPVLCSPRLSSCLLQQMLHFPWASPHTAGVLGSMDPGPLLCLALFTVSGLLGILLHPWPVHFGLVWSVLGNISRCCCRALRKWQVTLPVQLQVL